MYHVTIMYHGTNIIQNIYKIKIKNVSYLIPNTPISHGIVM